MDGFCGMEDWGLQAVVSGSSGDFSNIFDQDSFFDFSTGRDELVFEFPDIFDGVNICGDDELEGLYKPFYPAVENCVTADQISTAVEVKEETRDIDVTKETSDSTARADAYAPKYKRRKNQHKRVVVQVSAEGLSSDVWAWRKYGQKPIKGSPYPRSYYRCSSSKGCLARKQVEQSCKDPGMFIITYSAEHNHSQPTRRNSLAGTIRQKFPPSKTPNDRKHDRTSSEDSISGSNVCVQFQSQETLMPLPMDEDLLQAAKCNQDGKLLDDDDLIFNDEFFSGLEEFDGLNSEILPISCHSSTQQFPLSSCS